jgi:hypothetical protein
MEKKKENYLQMINSQLPNIYRILTMSIIFYNLIILFMEFSLTWLLVRFGRDIFFCIRFQRA